MIRILIEDLIANPELLKQFSSDMLNGAVAIIPTDTLYGFAVAAHNPAAVKRLYQIKNRCTKKPFILLLPDIKSFKTLGISTDSKTEKLISQHWPGALTAIFARPESHKISAFNFPTLGIRIPAHAALNQLMASCESWFLTTSANRSCGPSHFDPEEVAKEFCSEADWFVDGGTLSDTLPSTIIDLSGKELKILRQGTVKIKTQL